MKHITHIDILATQMKAHEQMDLLRHAELDRRLLEADTVRERISGERERALAIAKTDLDRRLKDMNMFREQIATERALYLTREGYLRDHAALSDRVNKLELLSSRLSGSYWALGALISAVVAAVTIVVNLWFR